MSVIHSFSELLKAACRPPTLKIAVAGADTGQVLQSAVEAQRLGLASPLLVGCQARIRGQAAELGLDLTGCEVVDCGKPEAAAQVTVDLVRTGQAQVAVKGLTSTTALLRAVLDRNRGIRSGQLVSHVGVFQIPGFPGLLCISDGGVVLCPSLEQKVEIIRNAVVVARALGIERPRVALLASSNEVTVGRRATQEAASLAAMGALWDAVGAWVDGPFTADVAVDARAAEAAGKSGEVAGRANVIVGPSAEATNIICKAITYFAGGRMAGVVIGARAPVVLGSRSDPLETRLACIAVGVFIARLGLAHIS